MGGRFKRLNGKKTMDLPACVLIPYAASFITIP